MLENTLARYEGNVNEGDNDDADDDDDGDGDVDDDHQQEARGLHNDAAEQNIIIWKTV